MLASTHDAIIGSTRLDVINSWNAAATGLYGYSAEEIIGQARQAIIAPDFRAKETEALNRVLRGEPTERYETQRICKDQSVLAVSVTMSAILDDANAVVGVVMVSGRQGEPSEAQDSFDAYVERSSQKPAQGSGLTTSRIQMAQAQQNQRLEVLGRLAGGVAHDFNNLLAVILNYAAFVSEELAAACDAPPDWQQRLHTAQRDVGQIERAAQRATALTHQLLAFARREVAQARVINLDDVVGEVEQLLHRTLGEDVELLIGRSDELWPVLADPGQVEQILVNLAVNARDAMPGGGTLRIDTANITVDTESIAGGSPAPAGRYVRLRVGDSGTGMPAEIVAHVFEPFFTTKRDAGGTGLGLATVYGIVTQAEATIAIKSAPGAGTTFTIMLPVTSEAAIRIAEPAPYYRVPAGETVLVVEDEEALREVTERIFTRSGYHVITAGDGVGAIALATTHVGEIHLLVTDVVMPRMRGKEVAERVREIRPDIAVLFMSGYAQPVLASQGRLEPGAILVDKPFSSAELLAKAGQVLNGNFPGFATIRHDGGTA
ncbi:hybrid sensor histidine kinase/response regulator [Actinoplanes palleronii]|uniref:histidine kinase n=1 Tax=Actinoplanes palleronii TaxID=113570 RepID=A0ABQ4B9N6_9ACTN|nr:ATP-binding protein [Actinoplanes palleronii]GIE67426.1 histidine kinase [Actinoplanes palleronii]